MKRTTVRSAGIAALAIASAATSATAATSAPSGADTTTGMLNARLHTRLGYLGRGPSTELPNEASWVGSVPGANGHILFGSGTIRDLDPMTDHTFPVLGSGFSPTQDDPNQHGALDESAGRLTPVGVSSAGAILGASEDGVFATAPSTVSEFGRVIRAGQATRVYGGGTSTQDGGWSTNMRMEPTAQVSTSGGWLATTADLRDGPDSSTVVRVVPPTSGTYFGRAMQAGRAYEVGPRLDVTNSLNAGVVLDSRGNVIATEENGLRITAVADGAAYGVQMEAGKSYRIFSGPVVGWERLAIDPQDNIYFPGYDQGRTTGMLLPAHDGSRFGLQLKTGAPVQVHEHHQGVHFDEYGAALYEKDVEAPGDRHYELRALAPTDGVLYGQKVTAGQEITIRRSHPPAPFPGEGRDPRDLQLQASTVDSDRGDLLVTGIDGYGGKSTAVFVPKQDGINFGRPMLAGRPYHLTRGTHAQNPWTPEPVGGEGIDPRQGSADTQDMVFDRDGNAVMLHGDPDLTQQVVVVARRDGQFYGRSMKAGLAYRIAGTEDLWRVPKDGAVVANARLDHARRLVVDRGGNILIAGYRSLQLVPLTTGRHYGKAMSAGRVYSLSAPGAQASSGDGGPIAAAGHGWILQLALDPATGDIYVTEGNGNPESSARVRVLANHTGTLLGTSVIKGKIYTVAGGPSSATPGDDHQPATRAYLDFRSAATPTDDGRLLVLTGGQLRRVERDGTIHTIAGQERPGFSRDGIHATRAYLMPTTSTETLEDADLDLTEQGDPLMAGADGVRTLR